VEDEPGQEVIGNTSIPVPGHLIDASIATLNTILNSHSEKARSMAKDFQAIDLNPDEYRGLMALLGMQDEKGYAEEIFKRGITLTAYELCKRMNYPKDARGRFGGKAIKAAVRALLNLSKKTFTVYFTKFKRKDRDKNVYDIVVVPNCPLIDILYTASDVTEEELAMGKVEEKATKIHVRIKYFLYCQNYFRLFESNFYPRLKIILNKQDRRISKYHWLFGIWRLKHKHRKTPLEINVDKLAAILKMPGDPAHRTRARNKIREIYKDFKVLGYIKDYKIDILAQSGGTKDIIMFAGQTG
jgi:hypothetical protein